LIDLLGILIFSVLLCVERAHASRKELEPLRIVQGLKLRDDGVSRCEESLEGFLQELNRERSPLESLPEARMLGKLVGGERRSGRYLVGLGESTFRGVVDVHLGDDGGERLTAGVWTLGRVVWRRVDLPLCKPHAACSFAERDLDFF